MERRFYTRLGVNIDSSFVLQRQNPIEITGTILDICEEGMNVIFLEELELQKDFVDFQFYTYLNYMNQVEKQYLVTGKAEIMWIDKSKNMAGMIFRQHSDALDSFISDLKVSEFVDHKCII